MKEINLSDLKIEVKHFGHPINNWGYEIKDKDGRVIETERATGCQYINEDASVFNKAYSALLKLSSKNIK